MEQWNKKEPLQRKFNWMITKVLFQNLDVSGKAVLRGKFVSLNLRIRKEKSRKSMNPNSPISRSCFS